MHAEIQAKLGHVQSKTAKLVHEQEQDLLKAFKQRLGEVQIELEREKVSAGNGASGSGAQARKLERRVDDERARADREDRLHAAHVAENAQRNVAASLQADDKEYLIKQLVREKRTNVALRARVTSLEADARPLRAQYGQPGCAFGASPSGAGGWAIDGDGALLAPQQQAAGQRNASHAAAVRLGADDRYQDVLRRLTKLLGAERKALAVAAHGLRLHRAAQTPLERGLQQCIESVRSEKAGTAAASAVRARWAARAAAQAAQDLFDHGPAAGGGDGGAAAAATGAAGEVPEEVEAAAQAAAAAAAAAASRVPEGHTLRELEQAEPALSWSEREQVLERWLAMDGVVEALTTQAGPSAVNRQQLPRSTDSALVLPPV
jgi:hypothetical protein